MQWLKEQVEWIKSFISHNQKSGEPQKGKIQSVAIAAVIWTFCFTYIRVSWNEKSITDVPEIWAMLIAYVIGAKIYDSMQAKKVG
jgi:hypothetical protein